MQNEKAVPCKKQKSCKQKAVLSHPDMNPNAPERKEDWKVYFNGSLWGHHGRERARGQGGVCTKVVPMGGARLVRAVRLRLRQGHRR